MKYIISINKHYYFNIKCPCYLQSIIVNAPHIIRFSLHTTNREHAQIQAVKIKAKLDELMFAARIGIIRNEDIEKKLNLIGIKLQGSRKYNIRKEENKLSVLFNRYKEEKIKNGWCTVTAKENVNCFKLFLEFAGENIETSQINHNLLLEYRNLLQKLPTNRKKKFPNVSLDNVVKLKHDKTISNKQINRYLLVVTGLLNWAYQHEIIQHNPAHHLLLPIEKRGFEQRSAFTANQLKEIKKTLISQKNTFKNRQERFWVPIIAMYSGMRLNEICQLHTSDIIELDSIYCFSINDNEATKYIKTKNAIRIIPVHLELIELGFLEYLQDIESKNHIRLFPNLVFNERTKKYGRQLSTWFSKFKKRHITENKLLVFHSFRHSIATELKQLMLPTEVISEILGHSIGSLATGRYGKRYNPKTLLEALIKLPY